MISEFLASLFLAYLPTPLVCFASLRPSLSSFHRFRLLSLTQPFNQFISSGTDDSGGCLRAMISWIRLATDRQASSDMFVHYVSVFRRMGNCLKSPGGANDDISLLRDSNTNNSNSVEQLQQPPAYIQVHICPTSWQQRPKKDSVTLC